MILAEHCIEVFFCHVMSSLTVIVEIALLCAAIGAVKALERSFSSVCQEMPLERVVGSKLFAADVARYFTAGKASASINLEDAKRKNRS